MPAIWKSIADIVRWAISWEVAEGTTLGHFVDDKARDREHGAHAWLHDVAQFRFFGVA